MTSLEWWLWEVYISKQQNKHISGLWIIVIFSEHIHTYRHIHWYTYIYIYYTYIYILYIYIYYTYIYILYIDDETYYIYIYINHHYLYSGLYLPMFLGDASTTPRCLETTLIPAPTKSEITSTWWPRVVDPKEKTWVDFLRWFVTHNNLYIYIYIQLCVHVLIWFYLFFEVFELIYVYLC